MEPGFYKNALSHYTTIDKAVNCILSNKTLRFSSISSTNDPYEKYPYAFTMNKNNERHREQWLNNVRNNNFIKEYVKLICFAQDREKTTEKEHGFILFSNGLSYAKPRMWAQYANTKDSSGICLIIDRDKLEEKVTTEYKEVRVEVGKVNYLDENQFAHNVAVATCIYDEILKIEKMEDIKAKLIDTYFDTYFMSKHIDWKDENEYRVLLFDSDNQERFISIDGCLEAVVLGIEVGEEIKEKIIKLLDKFSNRPKLMQIELWDTHLQLVNLEG